MAEGLDAGERNEVLPTDPELVDPLLVGHTREQLGDLRVRPAGLADDPGLPHPAAVAFEQPFDPLVVGEQRQILRRRLRRSRVGVGRLRRRLGGAGLGRRGTGFGRRVGADSGRGSVAVGVGVAAGIDARGTGPSSGVGTVVASTDEEGGCDDAGGDHERAGEQFDRGDGRAFEGDPDVVVGVERVGAFDPDGVVREGDVRARDRVAPRRVDAELLIRLQRGQPRVVLGGL